MNQRDAKKKRWNRASRIALGAVLALLAATLIGRTVSRGDDFLVFYRVAQRFWDGVRPYDQVTYGNMVFKYPPWLLPAFLPFGFLDLLTAKILWGAIEAFSLGAIVFRLHRGFGKIPEIRPEVQAIALLSLFALFGSHGMTGQITLPLLALALWIDPVRDRFPRFFVLVWALSAKMTSLFPLVQARKRKRLLASTAGCFVACGLLSLPIYFKSYDRHYKAMKVEWTRSMFSGTEEVANVRIGFTTREAQGLPSLILRKAGMDETEPAHVLAAIAFSALAIAVAWGALSRRLPPEVQWLGWLALLPAVQPLAWFHVFLFAYPVLAVSAELAIRQKNRKRLGAIAACALFIGAVTAKTLGQLGAELELWSIKLWGTLGAVWIFRRLFRELKDSPKKTRSA